MLKIYLETTIFNFPFADDAPQYRDATLKMFKKIENGLFAPYTSDYVIDELKDDKSAKRTDMLSLIDKYCIKVFTHKPLSVTLATEYVKQGMIPKNTKQMLCT